MNTVNDLFSDKVRRNPFPMYDYMRRGTPVLHAPPPFNFWMIFDYEGVRRTLTDHQTFSSSVPGPKNWFILFDPPRHTKLRGLLAKAFTPRMIAGLEPRIRQLSRQLLDQSISRGEMDLASDYSVPLPMMVIAEMIGIPPADWQRFRRWSDAILRLSYTLRGLDDAEAARALGDFRAVTLEMNEYLMEMIQLRRASRVHADSTDADLLARLITAEVDGQRLTHEEILGFFQLLILGGQETTANLINNAILCLLENPDQLARLRRQTDLLPSAIEEVLRYRSPLQWIMRTPAHSIEMSGQTIAAGELVLAMIGSANHDPRQFPEPARFDITRDPNPHIAFGHGTHFCMGAALSRLEAKIALTDLLERTRNLSLASDEPWEPRKGLNVHGPSHLPIRFQPA
jgi:cytochrome P450